MSKVRFGVRLNVQGEMGATGAGFDTTLEMARMAEDLGFDSVWIPDHLENAHLDRERPILEHWTTLTAVATGTDRIRLGGHSLNDNLRHPGLSAKIAATFDHISGGRLIIAPGSGWFEAEAKAYGLDWYPPPQRKAKLRESVEIMQKLFTEEVTSYSGEYFHLDKAYCNPKPLQQPYPPFWIAGEAPKTQEMVVEFGDRWFMYSRRPEQVADLMEQMRSRTDRTIPVSLSSVFLSGESESQARDWATMYAEERKHRFTHPPTVDDVMASNLLGDRERLRERVEQWHEAGVDYIVIQPMPPMAGIRFFGEHIIPMFS